MTGPGDDSGETGIRTFDQIVHLARACGWSVYAPAGEGGEGGDAVPFFVVAMHGAREVVLDMIPGDVMEIGERLPGSVD